MTRSLAALACFGSLLFGAPSQSDAGVIPWMYDSIFGYGPAMGGGYGWGAGYGYRGYTAGYAPFYSGYTASYAPVYGGSACCGTTTNYAPSTGYGYGYGGACCSPCGTSSCSPCGSSCGTGCGSSCDPCVGGNCPGGNCATGTGSTPVQSTPTDTGTGAQPTYVPPTRNEDRTPAADDFVPSQNNPPRTRDGLGAGPSVPSTGGYTSPSTSGSIVDPNSTAPPPDFAPNQPKPGYFDRKDDQSKEMGSPAPKLNPIRPGDKVAFKTPARLTRTTLEPVFELPTIVSAPPAARPDAVPTAVVSK